MQLALTRIYSWGWGEGSGHHAATTSSQDCPAGLSELGAHSCVPGAPRLPPPAGTIQAETELPLQDHVCTLEAKADSGVMLLLMSQNQIEVHVSESFHV